MSYDEWRKRRDRDRAGARMLAATTGTRLDQVAVYVDGMPLTNRLPPKDVIQSVRINANPFSAEFAEPGVSRVEILTKPAAQHYHRSGRVDFNDARMNSRNFFEPARPDYQARTYEGHVGGPIVRERLPFASLVVISSDDPYGSPERAAQLASDWGSASFSIGERGHINGDSGLGDWPQGRELLRELLRRSDH